MKPRKPSLAPIVTLSVAALACLAVVVGLYLHHFTGEFSTDDEQWARFGEYVGGVLGPLYSLLALIGVLWTLQLQRQSIEDTQRQQFHNEFFNLLQGLARFREGIALRSTPNSVPDLNIASRVAQVPMQYLVRDAWGALKSQMNERTETNEEAARQHLIEVAGGKLRREFDDVFRLTDRIFQLYRFVYRAHLRPEEKGYYVEMIDLEVTAHERSLLLFALLTQPKSGAAFKVANDLRVFGTLDLRSLGMPPPYYNVLRDYFPDLPLEGSTRPVGAI
jgi:hypothetical protein